MPPAACFTDQHVCLAIAEVIPHVGGLIVSPSLPTVLSGRLPAGVTEIALASARQT